MTTNATVSRNLFASVCVIAAILAVALFICVIKSVNDNAWTQDGEGTLPFSRDLTEALKERGAYAVAILTDETDKEDRIFSDIDGNLIDYCAKLGQDGTIEQIPGENCGLDKKITWKSFEQITLLGVDYNPQCKWGMFQGYIAWIHKKPLQVGHTFPCH